MYSLSDQWLTALIVGYAVDVYLAVGVLMYRVLFLRALVARERFVFKGVAHPLASWTYHTALGKVFIQNFHRVLFILGFAVVWPIAFVVFGLSMARMYLCPPKTARQQSAVQ